MSHDEVKKLIDRQIRDIDAANGYKTTRSDSADSPTTRERRVFALRSALLALLRRMIKPLFALAVLLPLPAQAESEGMSKRLQQLMAVVEMADEPDSAAYLKTIDEAMALAEKEGQDSAIATCLFDKATYLAHRFGSEHGVSTLDELKEFFERTGADECRLYDGWLNVVLAMQNEGRMIFAVAEVQKMLSHAQKQGSDYGMATAYTTLGSLYENSYDTAMRNLDLAIEHLRKGGYQRDLYFVYYLKAHVASINKHPELVLDYVGEIRKLPELERNAQLADYLTLQACIDLNDREEAQKSFDRLNALWEKGGIRDDYENLIVEAMARYICAYDDPDKMLPLLQYVGKGNETSRLQLELEYHTARKDYQTAFAMLQRLRDLEKKGIAELQESELASANAFFNNNVLEAEKQQLVIDNMEGRNRLHLVLIGFMSLTVLLLTYIIYNTHRKNKIITKQSERVKESEEMKTVFIQSMSHEIRTPLNHITGFASLLAMDGFSEEERQEFVQSVQEGTDNLTGIVDNMLEMAKFISSTGDLEVEDVNICDLCREQLSDAAAHNHKSLNITFEASDEYTTRTNRLYLRKVIHNLLNNALKFTEQGSVTLSITSQPAAESTHINNTSSAKAPTLVLSVADTGIGIPPDKQEWVFERFAKVDSFVPGVGIGLYLCRRIIARLGGRIYVDSAYTSGCRIIVELPM